MRADTGKQRKLAAILQAPQHRDDFANAVVLPAVYQRNLAAVIEIHHRGKFLVPVGAFAFPLDEVQLTTQMLRELF